ncbi:hypothetical protein L7F22_023036 [Adiantum nelumboides]|nr:hypothetical protein [Adiantum nelumboides]
MTEFIAVGLVIVSGEPVELRFTDSEREHVLQQVLHAHQVLAEAELAANITFTYPQGVEGSNELWYNVLDGGTWAGDKRVFSSYVSAGPSAVVFQSKLYYFYGSSGRRNSELWYNVSFDGSSWEGDTKVAATMLSASPSCIVHQGKLHCFHVQGASDNEELWCNNFNGSDWGDDIKVADVTMSQAPSTVSFRDQLYCFYQGRGDSGEMRYGSFDDVSREGIRRDPTLRYLGFSSGYYGCVQFAQALQQSSRADWAYVAFFTKYPLNHFAYAGGVRICMEYANHDKNTWIITEKAEPSPGAIRSNKKGNDESNEESAESSPEAHRSVESFDNEEKRAVREEIKRKAVATHQKEVDNLQDRLQIYGIQGKLRVLEPKREVKGDGLKNEKEANQEQPPETTKDEVGPSKEPQAEFEEWETTDKFITQGNEYAKQMQLMTKKI